MTSYLDKLSNDPSLPMNRTTPRAPKRQCSYDPNCEVLARHFLEDGTDKAQAEIDLEARALAQDIQNCVEGFFLVRSKSD